MLLITHYLVKKIKILIKLFFLQKAGEMCGFLKKVAQLDSTYKVVSYPKTHCLR